MKSQIKKVTSDLNSTLKVIGLAGAEHDWSKEEIATLAGYIAALDVAGLGITDTLRFVYQNKLLQSKTQKEMFELVRTTRRLQGI